MTIVTTSPIPAKIWLCPIPSSEMRQGTEPFQSVSHLILHFLNVQTEP